MKILHITPSSEGYEEVELLANRISRKNGLALILKNGQEFMTGGFLIKDTPKIREILDSIPSNQQYEFVREFKMDPFVKSYFDDDNQ
jgi:hypothetical protein